MDSSTEVAIAVKRTPREALISALSKLTQPLPSVGIQDRVVIKPSILDPEMPGNTSLEIVQATARLFEGSAEVLLAESDNPYRSVEDAYSKLDYTSLAKSKVRLFNLSTDKLEPMTLPGYYFQDSHLMPQVLKPPLYLINVATLKYRPHESVIWGGIKNLFGLLPEVEKKTFHEHLENVLLDLVAAFRPKLTIIDLTEVIVGRRLTGKRMKVGGVVVGIDPIAVDSYCAGLFGLDPMEISYLQRAHTLGFGEALLDRINVRGTEHQKQILSERMRI